MSKFNKHIDSLITTFKEFQIIYNWEDDETIRNFLEVVTDLEVTLLYRYPITVEGNLDESALELLEYAEAERLFGIKNKYKQST